MPGTGGQKPDDDEIKPDDEEPIEVGTLGMFIIDRFQYRDVATDEDLGDQGWKEQIGGGGTYFAVGASVWLDPCKVLMIVDRGPDFPPHMQAKLDSFVQRPECNREAYLGSHSLWRYRSRPDGTTRALNIYRGDERDFKYLTPKIRLDPIDLAPAADAEAFFPRIIHFVCSPTRAIEICKQIDQHPEKWPNSEKPLTIWEPIPDSARPENLDAALQACGSIDIISPNHEEMAAFLSGKSRGDGGVISKDAVEGMGATWLQKFNTLFNAGVESHKPVVCIRSGALGAFYTFEQSGRSMGVEMIGHKMWVPAWHAPEERGKIVDVTGAGNAWLGGFAAGLAQMPSPRARSRERYDHAAMIHAAQLGSVTASFAIEQFGLPLRTIDEEDNILWNGDLPEKRLARLKERMQPQHF